MVVPKVVPLTDTNYIPRDLSAVALGLVTWSCDVKHITSICNCRVCVVYLYTCARLHNGTCTQDPNMNLIIQYGLLGLVLGLGLGLGLGFILYCRIWRPLALPYMCPQPQGLAIDKLRISMVYLTIRLFI